MTVAYQYAVVRAVPRVDRGECVNVAVLMYCGAHSLLAIAAHVDEDRLRALDPDVDVEAVRAALEGLQAVCEGSPAAGPAAQLAPLARFGWLTAPRSTVVQPGPVHCGVAADAADAQRQLHRLLTRLVL